MDTYAHFSSIGQHYPWILFLIFHWVHSFLHIAMTLSQTRQRNGIVPRCAKGHCDVQNAARAVEKNAHNQSNTFHG